MIILVCKMFKVKINGKYSEREELLVDYAFDEETGQAVIVPCSSPSSLGGVWCSDINEWVLL